MNRSFLLSVLFFAFCFIACEPRNQIEENEKPESNEIDSTCFTMISASQAESIVTKGTLLHLLIHTCRNKAIG
ncbi:MAG: hypothetical protein MJ231_09055 [bacterium]|nr:hypothetical protein [bacterium]